MSGHSKWHSIKHKKANADAKRGKLFTKIIREITVAAKSGGGDADSNPKLRLAVQKAKEANMPSNNIERAIKKGTGELPGVNYEELVYEGYLPNGVACVIDILTDNKNRTVAEIRTILSKNGGSLGSSGSVLWMFEKQGVFILNVEKDREDEVMELGIEEEALNVDIDELITIYTDIKNYDRMKEALESGGFKVESAGISWIAQNLVKLNESEAQRIMRIVELLEDNEDVQSVSTNFDF